MPLSAEGIQNVKQVLDGATSEGPSGSPGLVFYAVDKAGNKLVEHAAGTRGIDSKEPVDQDTTFWIASMTKQVATIGVMQLVEQGKIPLDDADFVKKVAPEIAAKKVYADGATPTEQEKGVTVRMLLAHTAGFGYAFLDPRIKAHGIDEFTDPGKAIMDSPMVNQPGSVWEYGINIDWAGIILERVAGQKLNDYLQEHVLAPLGVESTTMFPTKEMRANMATIHQRDPSGVLRERDHIFGVALKQETKEQQDAFFHSAGAGLFSKPKEYVKVLLALLNEGKSPLTGKSVLKPETVKQMWENQIPDQPNFARAGIPPADPLLANASPEMYPQEGNPPQGWGLSMFLTIAPGATGRGANTGWWAGLCNSYWWADREKGVAGVIASQVLPFGDPKVVTAWVMAEKAVYDGLQ